jgi:L-ribulose-5-phosphate 3-epimerase
MMLCGDWPIGVCSWSLGNDLEILNKLKSQSGIEHIHLALRPAMNDEYYLKKIISSGWKISATMTGFPQEDYSTLESIKKTGGIVPDECWEYNKRLVLDAIDMTASLGAKYLEFHFGFIDNENIVFIDRVKCLADAAAKKNVVLLMETGQEAAQTLAEFLEELNHPALAVNFDPANMILYGKGDPIEAVSILSWRIKNVHIKDALASKTKANWGSEVVWGNGEVGQEAFLGALRKNDYEGTLSIEREAGENRVNDIKSAINQLSK